MMTEVGRLDEAVEFAVNPEPRCACALLLDTSGSMLGEPIRLLNEGLLTFQAELLQDDQARKRVEVSIVTFGERVEVVQDFVTADQFVPPQLTAAGLTPMGGGIQTALDLIEGRKASYKANRVPYYQPWVFLITDGQPQGEAPEVVEQAARRVRAAEAARQVAFFAVGVEGADLARLATIAVRTPLKLAGLNFRELFVWLSRSMKTVSRSTPGAQVPLPPPSGWAQV
jgi:uncharacterized protein YegL